MSLSVGKWLAPLHFFFPPPRSCLLFFVSKLFYFDLKTCVNESLSFLTFSACLASSLSLLLSVAAKASCKLVSSSSPPSPLLLSLQMLSLNRKKEEEGGEGRRKKEKSAKIENKNFWKNVTVSSTVMPPFHSNMKIKSI